MITFDTVHYGSKLNGGGRRRLKPVSIFHSRPFVMRSENEIFNELAVLCLSPGYIHAVAYICLRDNLIVYSGEMKPEDMQHLFSATRLIRTEISTLIGLLLKDELDYTNPTQEKLEGYVEKTELLLDEMHQAMSLGSFTALAPQMVEDKEFNPFTAGSALREPIFYGGESAYSFQYRDISPSKYGKDDEWIIANKGFSIRAARDVVHAIGNLQDRKSIETLNAAKAGETAYLSMLEFSKDQVINATGLDNDSVENVLAAFVVPSLERNKDFNSLHDFNIANVFPIVQVRPDVYVLFHIYSLVEALYEAPFYWMGADAAYVNTAMRHRGQFTEEFSAERLVRVFGQENVFKNVDIFASKSKKVAEIDVLVLFGNRAIVLQAKSKRLTLEARRGNDGQIKDDFKKSIQDSCDQGYLCANFLNDPNYNLVQADTGKTIVVKNLKEIYVLCVISDHYPALAFQARQFLKFQPTDIVAPPFVLDVFMLDAMTEMLESPLRLLSFIDRRVKYSDKILASHELTILSYHLKQNLWLDEEHDLVMMSDDISSDLDLAMLVRRENIQGKRTPEGILTRFSKTTLGEIVRQIEQRPEPGTIDLGFMLLTLGENTVVDVSKGIDKLARLARLDGKSHDLTVRIGSADSGFTIHCNDDPTSDAAPRLSRHCERRKYTEHAKTWFGICVRPSDISVRFGVNLEYKWEQSAEMDALTGTMAPATKLTNWLESSPMKTPKVGRNAPCSCGSGKKYKFCCLGR